MFSVASFDLSSTRMMGFFGPVIAGLLLTYYNYTVALAVSALTLAGAGITFAILKSNLLQHELLECTQVIGRVNYGSKVNK